MEWESATGAFSLTVDGRRTMYHPEDTHGCACINALSPGDRLHVIVVGNDENLEPLAIAVGTARRLLSSGYEEAGARLGLGSFTDLPT